MSTSRTAVIGSHCGYETMPDGCQFPQTWKLMRGHPPEGGLRQIVTALVGPGLKEGQWTPAQRLNAEDEARRWAQPMSGKNENTLNNKHKGRKTAYGAAGALGEEAQQQFGPS